MRATQWLAAGVLILAVAALGAQEKAKGGKDDKFDAAKLVGTWKYVSAVRDGEKVDEKRLKDGSVVITKETITLKGEETFVIKYTLDAKKTPVTVNMTITEGPVGKDAKAEGILELKGDELKLCYAPPGATAPKSFEAKEGSKLHLMVLKRAK